MATTAVEIADELRGQIVAGRIKPGDRLPSAREITRRWGVAMATASRVHALLRADGLARPVPGVGTVAEMPDGAAHQRARPRRRTGSGGRQTETPMRRAQGLDVDRIVTAGIAIADSEGLDAVSMRRVALATRTAPMSLYRHVIDKDDLVLRMQDRALALWRPGNPGEDWRDRLTAAHRELWRLFRRHPWLAPALSMTRPQLVRSGMRITEWVMASLEGLGLSHAERFDITLTLFAYVRGTAVLIEPEVEAELLTGIDADAWMDTRREQLDKVTSDGAYPELNALGSQGYVIDLDGLFERGLALLLDGLALRLDRGCD